MMTISMETEFKESIRQEGVTIVEFGAVWCPPCKTLLPILDRLDSEYEGSVAFLKVDCEEVPAVAAAYDIMSMPTVIVFHNGEPVEKLVGLRTKEVYQNAIARYN